MSQNILDHIIELKTSVAAIEERTKRTDLAVSGEDGEGGLTRRISVLEHDRTRVKAWAGAGTFLGTALGWIISQIHKGG